MRKLFMLGAILAAMAFPTASHAQVTLGLRLGYASAMGDAFKDAPMTDGMKSQVPIQVDAMYRISPEWAAGLYFSYGFGQLGSSLSDSCSASGVDCSISTLRVGAQATYAFTSASQQFVPWLGVGTGYESATQKVAISGVSVSQDYTGWEYVNLQVGGDYKVNPQFAFGPYIMYSVGQFSSIEGTSIPDTAMHEFLSFGIRGEFDL